MMLVGMAAYLRCSVTGEVVSACHLDDADAERALGTSELLRVDSRWAGDAHFPRRAGIGRQVVRDVSWPTAAGQRLGRHEAMALRFTVPRQPSDDSPTVAVE